MLIGMSRTLQGGRTVAFEFMRIAAGPDGVVYIAQPRGKPPVEFALETWDGTTAVFVNRGGEDRVKRIAYRRDGAAAMTARIEGAVAGANFSEDYAYRRAGAADIAIEALYARFVRDLRRALDVPTDAGIPQIVRIAEQRFGPAATGLQSLLLHGEAVVAGHRVSEPDMLNLARQIEQFRRVCQLVGV